MPLTLTWRDATRLPVDAESLRPDALRDHPTGAIARYPIAVGNAVSELGDLFHLKGELGDETRMIIEGDLRSLNGLGRRMTTGHLIVRGDVGHRLGAELSGGTIEVHGSVGDRAGSSMSGGLLHIRGSAGDLLGGALPGARVGMRDGMILVEGPVGEDVGLAMRRGTIALTGPVGDGLGRGMIAGSIFAFGPIGHLAGAGMKRGTIALFGGLRAEILPTFRFACCIRPHIVTLYLGALRTRGFPVPPAAFSGPFERYNGDLLEGGHGELLVWDGN